MVKSATVFGAGLGLGAVEGAVEGAIVRWVSELLACFVLRGRGRWSKNGVFSAMEFWSAIA